jgi:hypothetical protein
MYGDYLERQYWFVYEKFKRFYYANEDIIPKTYMILDNAS